MTTQTQLNTVTTIIETLHRRYCTLGTKPDVDWSGGHYRVDRQHAIAVYDALVTAGHINAPVTLSDDFLATS